MNTSDHKVILKTTKQQESQKTNGLYFGAKPIKQKKSPCYRTSVDYLVVQQHYIIIITDEQLKPHNELLPFSFKITRNVYYSAMWKIIKETKCVVLQRDTCQEMLSLMEGVKNISPTAEYLLLFFKSRSITSICPSVIIPSTPKTKIPANASSAIGFLKHVSSGNKVRSRLMVEYGFGTIVSLWYMTVDTLHLPNMTMEFSSLLSTTKIFFPCDLQYDGAMFTKTNFIYNRHLLTYYLFRGDTEGFDKHHNEAIKLITKAEENVHVGLMFSRAALEKLCAVGNANPEYKHAIVRGCFAPLRGDSIVGSLISMTCNFSGFKPLYDANYFSFKLRTLVHSRPEVVAEKKYILKKITEISEDTPDNDISKNFPAAYGVTPLEEYNFYYTLNLARHCFDKYNAVKGSNYNHTGIPAYYFAMAEINIADGISWTKLALFALSHGHDLSTMAEDYNQYALLNQLPFLHSDKIGEEMLILRACEKKLLIGN